MADIEISVDAGTSKRLLTAGKYCDKNILVSASGGAASPVIEPLEVAENGTYTAPAGVDGYSPVTVNIVESEISYIELTIDISYLNVTYVCKNLEYEILEAKHSSESSLFTTVLSPKNSLIAFATSNINVINESGLEYLGQGQDENYIQWVYYKVVGDADGKASITAKGSSGGSSGGGSSDRISDSQALNIITGGEEA